jgi:hypothetical protein
VTVVTATVSSLLGILALGIFGFVYWDRQESEEERKKKVKTKAKELDSEKVRTIQAFFNGVMPEELKPGQWKELLWKRMLTEHTWLSLFSPFDEKKPFVRSALWFQSITRLLTYAFFNTVLAAVVFPDDGFCRRFESRETCINRPSVAAIVNACEVPRSLSHPIPSHSPNPSRLFRSGTRRTCLAHSSGRPSTSCTWCSSRSW